MKLQAQAAAQTTCSLPVELPIYNVLLFKSNYFLNDYKRKSIDSSDIFCNLFPVETGTDLLKKFLFLGFILLLHLENLYPQNSPCLLPVQVSQRTSLSEIKLTTIGAFGHIRKSRPGIPQHFHTGIDIKRPNGNYNAEPIFPLAPGRVISLRDDGPFAQIIIEHELVGTNRFWSVYEHIAGISVTLGEQVSTEEPLARFMNRKELEKYGWQFDHFHLEILKIKPRAIKPAPELTDNLYQSYNLECYSRAELTYYYYDPLEFLRNHLQVYKKNNEENDFTAWPSRFSNSPDQ
ncbi:MAG: hypothetical protein A2Y94_05560 [Caldithrix sp. RBG_13_44_9]|nr:MAG: hypothetical protein A2Y94_05560 [Caldithrix sp. RBG_13_44_9]